LWLLRLKLDKLTLSRRTHRDRQWIRRHLPRILKATNLDEAIADVYTCGRDTQFTAVSQCNSHRWS
jgi:hypothetical protein